MRMDVDFDDSEADAYLNDGLFVDLSEELDATDAKRVKKGKFDYIGVKPVVFTNRQLTKEQRLL